MKFKEGDEVVWGDKTGRVHTVYKDGLLAVRCHEDSLFYYPSAEKLSLVCRSSVTLQDVVTRLENLETALKAAENVVSGGYIPTESKLAKELTLLDEVMHQGDLWKIKAMHHNVLHTGVYLTLRSPGGTLVTRSEPYGATVTIKRRG